MVPTVFMANIKNKIMRITTYILNTPSRQIYRRIIVLIPKNKKSIKSKIFLENLQGFFKDFSPQILTADLIANFEILLNTLGKMLKSEEKEEKITSAAE